MYARINDGYLLWIVVGVGDEGGVVDGVPEPGFNERSLNECQMRPSDARK